MCWTGTDLSRLAVDLRIRSHETRAVQLRVRVPFGGRQGSTRSRFAAEADMLRWGRRCGSRRPYVAKVALRVTIWVEVSSRVIYHRVYSGGQHSRARQLAIPRNLGMAIIKAIPYRVGHGLWHAESGGLLRPGLCDTCDNIFEEDKGLSIPMFSRWSWQRRRTGVAAVPFQEAAALMSVAASSASGAVESAALSRILVLWHRKDVHPRTT